MIYHITTRDEWEAAQEAGTYRSPSLESEGFIHLSKASQILAVANAVYKGQIDLLILCVEEDKLTSELKWEDPAQPKEGDQVQVTEGDSFPHLYGELNLNAVAQVIDFPCKTNGTFDLPEEIS